MIGTNSLEESSVEILYPSISVCLGTTSDTGNTIKVGVGNNISAVHRSLNLSEIVLWLQLQQRNETGHLQRILIKPTDGKLENRDKKIHHFFLLLLFDHCIVGNKREVF